MTEEYTQPYDIQVIEQINYLGPQFTSKIINGNKSNNHEPSQNFSSHCQPMHNFSDFGSPQNFNQMLHTQQANFHNQFIMHHLNQYPYNLGQQYVQENNIQIKTPVNPAQSIHTMKMHPFVPIASIGQDMVNSPVPPPHPAKNFVSNVPVPPGKKYNMYPSQEQIGPNGVVFKTYQQRVWNEIIQVKDSDGTNSFKLIANNDIQPIWIVCNKDKFVKWMGEHNIIN